MPKGKVNKKYTPEFKLNLTKRRELLIKPFKVLLYAMNFSDSG